MYISYNCQHYFTVPFISDVTMGERFTNIEVLLFLGHYFKLGLEDAESALRIQELID